LNHDECRKALEDFDTPGLVLYTIALYTFQDALFGDPEQDQEEMDPTEIWTGLYEAYGAWVSDEGQNRLNALMLALRADYFYHDVEVFKAVASALVDGDIADVVAGEFDDIDAVDCAWAVIEVALARDQEEEPEFSSRVAKVIASEVSMHPGNLEAVQADIEQLYEDLMRRLIAIGVTKNELRLLDPEYADALEQLQNAAILDPSVS
jgi:hypothetical protein